MTTDITLISPLDGDVVSLSKVPDPVFSERMLGDGLAILPTSELIFAPMAGEIININPALHAFIIKNEDIELLIHVGLESISLKGEGFKMFVSKGQRVSAGQKILSFDLDLLTRKAASPLVMLVVTSPQEVPITVLADERVKTGLPLFKISQPTVSTESVLSSTEMISSLPVEVTSPNGLHARPAAVLAHTVSSYPYRVEICKNNQCADAKSIVGLMGMGLLRGDKIVFRIFGPKEQAKAMLVRLQEAFQNQLEHTLCYPTETPVQKKKQESCVRGLCASNGLAFGPAFILPSNTLAFKEDALDLAAEAQSFDQAIESLKEQMEKRLSEEKDPVTRDILNAHLVLLQDPLLSSTTHQTIQQGKTAAFAFNSAIRRSVDILKQTQNRFLMERIADLKDLRREVLCQLTGQRRRVLNIPPGSIVVADELLPSDICSLPADVAGVLLAGGSPTAHAGILLRNRNMPAIAQAGAGVLDIPAQTTILLDASAGKAVIAPTDKQVRAFQDRLVRFREQDVQDSQHAQEPAVTRDGVRIFIEGNISRTEEAARAYAAGADGFGLVRTEFLFQDRPFAPTEDEQHTVYQNILDNIPGKKVTFRLLDAGGDKPLPFITIAPEDNPIAGVRGMRALRNNEAFYRIQLRAMLRLIPQNRVRIMLPMISFLHEVIQFRKIFNEEVAALGINDPAQLGIMIEVPSAALIAEHLAQETDFFSIGTNDLTQYTLAIDRGHRELSVLSDSFHPAVLQLIAQTCQGAAKHHCPVSVCGAMAGDSAAVPLLVGLGVGSLAVGAGGIARAKAVVRQLDFSRCTQVAQEALKLADAASVRELLKKNFEE